MSYARRKLELRKLPAEEVERIVDDYAARAEAKAARRRGIETLRTRPTLREHAERTGVSIACLKQLCAGWTYKDVLAQIGQRQANG